MVHTGRTIVSASGTASIVSGNVAAMSPSSCTAWAAPSAAAMRAHVTVSWRASAWRATRPVATASSARNSVRRIAEDLRAGDHAAAERGAHTLKGVVGNLGLASLATTAGEVETAIRLGTPADAALDRLAPALADTVGALQRRSARQRRLRPGRRRRPTVTR